MSTDLDDAELFKQAMRHVTPLKFTDRVAHPTPSFAKALHPTSAQQQRRQRAVASPLSTAAPLSDGLFTHHQDIHHSFRVNGLSADALRRLRKETHSIRASLDLHGLNLEQARSTLYQFISTCAERRYKRVRIIHGQGFGSQTGTPILKLQTRHWLSQMPEVLGYISAPSHDGGEGAVLVLLRSTQKFD